MWSFSNYFWRKNNSNLKRFWKIMRTNTKIWKTVPEYRNWWRRSQASVERQKSFEEEWKHKIMDFCNGKLLVFMKTRSGICFSLLMFLFFIIGLHVWGLELNRARLTSERTDLVPGCYIPTLRTKERECQKFLDWR